MDVLLSELGNAIHTSAVERGFYDTQPINVAEKLCLIHSEVSEVVEILRTGVTQPDKHCPEYTALEVEMADILIRTLDLAAYLKCNIDGAVKAKMIYNATRPYKHGKQF